MKTYEITLELGGGVAGPMLSSIRRKAAGLGLTLAPFPFLSMAPANFIPVKVEGDDEAVAAFETWLVEQTPPAAQKARN